jgi:hypothetical protein
MFENLTKEDLAYIAGFLDGDGCLMAQVVKGDFYKYGYHIRISMVFFQKKDKHWFMLNLKKLLGYGYVRMRNDDTVEYVITGSASLKPLLIKLKPYVKLKLPMLEKLILIIEKKMLVSSLEDFQNLLKLVDSTELLTYSKKRINKELIVNKK